MMLEKKYDFIDFGCSKGGSLKFGQEVLGGLNGIGLDISPSKVEQTRALGFEAAEVDVTQLGSFPNFTRFVTMIDFLEHLPDQFLVKKCVEAACETATDFVFIRQPWFDSDGYLFRNKLKLYWSDWTGHPNTMTSLELHRIMCSIPKVKRWRIYGKKIITDSSDEAVHPLISSPDQHGWQEGRHEPKPDMVFAEKVFYQLGCIAVLTDNSDILDAVEKKAKWSEVLFDSEELKDVASPHLA